jgi:hypothetical protein
VSQTLSGLTRAAWGCLSLSCFALWCAQVLKRIAADEPCKITVGVLNMAVPHHARLGASRQIHDTNNVALPDVVRSVAPIQKYRLVTIKAVNTNPFHIAPPSKDTVCGTQLCSVDSQAECPALCFNCSR